jgi:hypothetical protein
MLTQFFEREAAICAARGIPEGHGGFWNMKELRGYIEQQPKK